MTYDDDLNRAEIGLLMDLLLECVLNGDAHYEVVTTGETATASNLLQKFMRAIVGDVPNAEESRQQEEIAPTQDDAQDTRGAVGENAQERTFPPNSQRV